jgi:predicted amidophosphoribosyltransferase
LRASLARVLDVALPQLCATCREPVDGAGLCPACWSKLCFIAPPYCERLGTPFPFDSGPGMLSMEAIADPPAYHRARAAVRYDDISSKLVHALKYGDRLDLAPTMGRWMANAGRELLADADAIVPVPLHWRRQWMRRFNQSALLAEIIAKASGRMVVHGALKRIKATPHQVGLGKAERAENVQGAFRVPADGKAEVTGRNWCWSTTCSRRGRPWTAARGPCCGAGPPPSMFPGCGGEPRSHIKRSVKSYGSHDPSRNLYHPLLPLLPRRQAAVVAQRGRVRRDRRQRRSERAK